MTTLHERLQDVLAAMREASPQCASFADRLEAAQALQAAPEGGEAVAWQIMRAAFVTADENYSGKRVAAVYADASMIGQRVRLIFDTTPPRHPADEGMAVTDEMVARACVAYDTAAVGEGFMSSLDGDEHTRWMTAALTAALQAGTP